MHVKYACKCVCLCELICAACAFRRPQRLEKGVESLGTMVGYRQG